MPFVPADLRIEPRWIAPMTVRDELLVDHSLLIRDGRILDILPTSIASQRYGETPVVRRESHLLMPGMINTQSDAAMLLVRGIPSSNAALGEFPQFARDGVMAAIAEMLQSGITSFSDRSYFPEEAALAAAEQGMRAVLGMPVTEAPSPWANTASQSLTRSLELRDKYRGHPLISTIFAPCAANTLSDAAFSRLATLADELDAGIMMDVHQSSAEINECIQRFGVRPIERLQQLGLLTPALNAVHMVHLMQGEIELAQRSGISVSLCPQSSLKSGDGLPAAANLCARGMRIALGSAGAATLTQGLWGEMKLIALSSQGANGGLSPWDVLHMATCGGAQVLGLESEVGTLAPQKWADLCCVDLSGPASQGHGDRLTQLVFNGGRDMVRDVWVAGRQLLSDGELTRLDWPSAAARSQGWAVQKNAGN
jgi:5-methylthioadenosine/S-adenosylhomocysteine deaminase